MTRVSEVRTSEGWGVASGDEIRLEDGRTTLDAITAEVAAEPKALGAPVGARA
jgi:hypothetical protein